MNQPIQKYVLGFLFNEAGTEVVLIRKSKPKWQAGLLNGVGGKIEEGEDKLHAMTREFTEECGVFTHPDNWREFAEMSGDDFAVYCFVLKDGLCLANAMTMEDEPVEKWALNSLQESDCISNIPWLLKLALDDNYGQPPYATIRYAEPYTFEIP